jgi:alcohol dehydrogenase class IV
MILVCSNSTRKFFPEAEQVELITCPADESLLEREATLDSVVAAGGGAVIDAAKILAKNHIVCYPTTAAGSCATSHSVYWQGFTKKSVKRFIPQETVVIKEFVEDLPPKVIAYTFYDAFSHCLDVLWSKQRNKESVSLVDEAMEVFKGTYSNADLVSAGNLAGQAIELCPTTLLHSLSYPLTGLYGIPHGKALGFLLPIICKYMNFDATSFISRYPKVDLKDYNIDFRLVIDQAVKYNKISKLEQEIDLEIILGFLSKGD